MTPGIYLLHKPVGPSSFSLVQACAAEARAAGPGKFPLCHGGTLDPFAEGLLLVLAGQATRLMDLLHAAPKSYRAEVTWGVETDNGDLLGKPVFSGVASGLLPERLDEALAAFFGWREQVPPAHSNKKVGGEPAYKRVLRGEKVELPPSRVFLYRARWVSHELPRASVLELTCRGGYYVRSLARDLGRTLGCGAHLSALSRSSIGPWSDPGPGRRVLVQGRGLLPWCRVRLLTSEEAEDLRLGRPISSGEVLHPDWPVPAGFPDPQGPIRAVHENRLVALLRESEGGLASFANLRGGL